ncbi:hypothetical protein LXL04_003505 [Taraxacum kok-saghyz]
MSKREADIGWKYGTLVEGTKNSVRCNFCFFISNGGITRHKHHLACDSSEVSKCGKVPTDVKLLFKEGFEKKKVMREAIRKAPHFDDVVELDDDDEMPNIISSSNGNGTQVKGKGPMDMFMKPSGRGGKKNGHLVGTVEHKDVQKRLRLDAVQKICRWLYDVGNSFNAVKYDSLGPALDAVALHGVGMKPPTYHEARGPMLQLEKEHTKGLMIENEMEKKTYGCSLMADGWRDRRGRSLINFLVNTPRGSMFIESVDASAYSHTGDALFKLFDMFIQKTGPQDVVQIVTDSAANNVLAGQLVEKKYPHIYWTPCAAHCIDLMLEDIFKMPKLKKTLERAVAVNNYIYNRTLLLNIMREFTGQRDMVRPAKTRFATAFITLNCFRNHKKGLKKMFTSEAWNKSRFSSEPGGAQAANTILLSSFWNNIDTAVKVGEPLLRVLRLVDGERKPPMGYIYEAMDRAKESIASAFNNNKEAYKQVFKIIDERWTCQLHQDLHAAGHYLNPELYYKNQRGIENDSEVMQGLMACVHKLSLEEEDELQILKELPLYRGAEGIFGFPMAKKMRSMLSPAEWWLQFGATAPTLRGFAVKVLSLTCSSSGCERNWSVFEHLHSKKRNRLEQQKLNDLVYIKYNRALRRRYEMRDTIDPIILDNAHVQDPNEFLEGVLGEEEGDALVFEGEDLTWNVVEKAMGVGEPTYATRRTSGRKEGANTTASTSQSKRRRLIDEDEEEEENDGGAYKEVVENAVQDEPFYEELDGL